MNVQHRKRLTAGFAVAIAILTLATAAPPLAWSQDAEQRRGPSGGGPEPGAIPSYWNELTRQVEKIRGLSFKTPVEPKTISKADLVKYLKRKLGEELPSGSPDNYFEAMAALGMIDSAQGQLQALLDLYSGQVAGFYEPDEKSFYIVRENSSAAAALIPGLDTDRLVFAHELTHALQDQNFDLGARIAAIRHNTDKEMALLGLIEGEAMDVMVQSMSSQLGGLLGGALGEDAGLLGEGADLAEELDLGAALGPEMWKSMGATLASSAMGDPALAKAPEFFVAQMVFPYIEGSSFVGIQRKGKSWSAIDEIYDHPPDSTEEILHPELYRKSKGATPVPLSLPGFLPAPWRSIYDDRLGEWGLGFYLKRALKEDTAPALARGWDGDHVFVYRNGAANAVAWVTRWDDAAAADRFFAAAKRAVRTRAGAKSAGAEPAKPTTQKKADRFEVKGGGTVSGIYRQGLNILLVERLPTAAHRVLVDNWLQRTATR